MFLALHSLGNVSSVSPLAVSLTSSSVSASKVGSGSLTTGSVTVSASGGIAPYSYVWTKFGGSATPAISSTTATTVSWSATGTSPSTYAASWLCTVTDAMGVTLASQTVAVNISFNTSTLSGQLSTPTLDAAQQANGTFSTGSVTASALGGVPSFNYAWTRVSGNTGISINSPYAATTTFSCTGTAPNVYQAVFQCVITDSTSSTANCGTVTVTFTYTEANLAISLDNYVVTGATENTFGVNTGDPLVTATATGGVNPYTYLWSYVSGDTGIYATSFTSSNTYFARYGGPVSSYSAVWKCTATDSDGTQVDSNVVTITLDFN